MANINKHATQKWVEDKGLAFEGIDIDPTSTAEISGNGTKDDPLKIDVDLTNYVEKQEGYSLISESEREKIDNAIVDKTTDIAPSSYDVVQANAVFDFALKKVPTMAELKTLQGKEVGQIVTLIGYHNVGDRTPLEYKWYETEGIEDDFSVINVDGGSWRLVAGSTYNAVKMISKEEAGLYTWDEYGSAPFTNEQYRQAYENGIAIENIIKKSYEQGYSKVIFQRGMKIPLVYNGYEFDLLQDYTAHAGEFKTSTFIRDIANMEIDFNDSELFVLFDSNNKNPYDPSVTPAHQITGHAIWICNTKDVTIKNLKLRGDSYFRSFSPDKIEDSDNTYGIMIGSNNKNTTITLSEIHGFRADSISGYGKGVTIGGLNFVSGDVVDGVEVSGASMGAYRTPKVSTENVIDNTVTISTTGYLRNPDFINDKLKIVFFKEDNTYITDSWVTSVQKVELPPNTSKIQFIHYSDYRASGGGKYGDYLILTTGASYGANIINNTLHSNMRGGISNLCNSTLIEGNYIHTIGRTTTRKLNWHVYGDSTLYGINFEDIYCDNLIVRNNLFVESGRGLITNCKQVEYSSNKIYQAIFVCTILQPTLAVIQNNHFFNGGLSVRVTTNTVTNKTKRVLVQNNIIEQGTDFSVTGRLTLRVEGIGCRIDCINNTLKNAAYDAIATNYNTIFSKNTLYQISKHYSPMTTLTNVNSEDLLASIWRITNTSQWRDIELTETSEFRCIKSRFNVEMSHDYSIPYGFYTPRKGVNNTLLVPPLSVKTTTNLGALNPASEFLITTESISEETPSATPYTVKFRDSIFQDVSLRIEAQYKTIINYADAFIKFKKCEFINSILTIYGKAIISDVRTLVFTSCFFDVSEMDFLLKLQDYVPTQTKDNVVVKFINCTFYSEDEKDFSFVKTSDVSKFTISEVESKYINLTII